MGDGKNTRDVRDQTGSALSVGDQEGPDGGQKQGDGENETTQIKFLKTQRLRNEKVC